MAPRFGFNRLPERFCNLDRLIETMQRRELDGIVIYTRPNVFYLSGWAPPSGVAVHETNGYGAVILARAAPGHPVLMVPEFDFASLLEQPSWIKDVRPYMTYLTPFDVAAESSSVDRFMPKALLDTEWGRRARAHYASSLVDGVRKAMADLGLGRARVGFDDLRLAQRVMPEGERIVDAYGTMKYVRHVKTPEELVLLKRAAQLNQAAIGGAIASYRPGMTWRELTHAYHRQAVELGGFVRDPGGIVVANPPGAETALFMQCGLEDFVVQPGQHVMWDGHGTLNGYCWDGGKTWVADGAPAGAGALTFRSSAAAMTELQGAVRPGAKVSQLQARARATLRQAGFAAADRACIFFHCLGLEHLDLELTDSRQDWAVEQGMVVSAHVHLPGDERARIWLEEIFLVTPAGGEPLFDWGYGPLTA